ncbi:MAG: hypothetical protein KC776_16935 [Myxococcales bacterium]|nr:hypothetical protein [Myxococcales bacterium]MCB9575503.1 hypothetical protein [Polyangiaceae bacterium]
MASVLLRLLAASLAFTLTGCTAGLGAGAAVVVGGAGVFAFDCSDHVVLSVRDHSGAERCGVPLIARQGDRERSLHSCEQSPLAEGTWTVTAAPGSGYVLKEQVTLPHRDGCDRVVYSVELTESAERNFSATAAGRSW